MRILLLLLSLAVFAACGRSDSKIADDLNAKLTAANPNVRATVKDGVATLTGTCPDESCKNVAETAAREVDGIKNVVNEITVNPPPPPPVVISSDDSLKTAVNDAIKNYNTVKAEVSEGVVTLTGNIKRSQLQELMQDVTATKPKKIENKLQIK